MAETTGQHAETPAPSSSRRRWHEFVQVIEVVMLAVVALATAWSGYQSSQWDGRQSLLYGQASSLRFEADAASTSGGQRLVADSGMFTSWLAARSAHDVTLQNLYVRRFTPDYRVAFEAWLKTDPFNDPKAPAGPGYMPQYRNPGLERAAELNEQAAAKFEAGTSARETSDRYVRDTVLFASVLFLLAVAQRFDWAPVRAGAVTVALALMVFVLASIGQLPRM
jgi:hypothetical protein